MTVISLPFNKDLFIIHSVKAHGEAEIHKSAKWYFAVIDCFLDMSKST